MTHLLLFTAFVVWYADFEGKDDAHEIAAHVKIDHVYQWLQRAVVFSCVWYLLWVLCSKPSTWPLLLGHAFLFSAVFRYLSNKLRGMHWAYVSPSNWYDFAYLVVRGDWKPSRWTWKYWRALWINSHWINYEIDENGYRRHIHRAGTTAYGFEITLFALGTAGAIMLL